uniref:AMP-dependent synthetase/ligase domain-containing protein n=1 Tax=Branchiostoma floridae TaxID=7739 RepID=C3ZJY2_BRAFL|eukprot:XP_002591138.1 hypothetical protein BRAFLDRAFT_105516 [Branchiostoma floridae]
MNTMSYLKSRSDLPLVEATLGQLLDDSAAKWPDHEAYVFRHLGVRMKLAEVKQEADRLAAGLLSIGVRRGDVVAWVMDTRPQWIVSFFAAAKIGAIVMPIIPVFFLSSVYKGMIADTFKKMPLIPVFFLSSVYKGMMAESFKKKMLLAPTDLNQVPYVVIFPVLTGSQTIVLVSNATRTHAEIVTAVLEERLRPT